MKKAYLLIIAAASVLLSCSKVGPEHSDPNAWMYDESLPVPIMMNTPGAETMTKSSVEDLSDIKQIGVFGLDRSENQPGWKSSGSFPNISSILLNNQKATVNSDGSINFDGETKYYPLSGTNSYDFYAYYPYKEAGSGLSCYDSSTATSYYTVTYSIGNTDILWAKAANDGFTYTEDGQQKVIAGYNAAYIRKVTNNTQSDERKKYLPNFEFKHMLTSLKFKLQATEEDAKGLDAANAVITGLTIKNTFNQATLVVADKAAEANEEGTLKTKDGGDTYSISLKDASGNATFSIKMSDGTLQDGKYVVEFGDGLMLVPNPSKGYFEGKLHIKIGDITQDIDLKFTDPNSEGGKNFDAGYRYTFSIVVKDPEAVEAYATLNSWTDATEGDITIDQFD